MRQEQHRPRVQRRAGVVADRSRDVNEAGDRNLAGLGLSERMIDTELQR